MIGSKKVENSDSRIVTHPAQISLRLLRSIEDQVKSFGGASLVELDKARMAIRAILNGLTDRERYVIWERFGLAGGEDKTLTEVAKPYHVTRERIRQIEVKAIRKIALALDPSLRDRGNDEDGF